MVKNTKVNSKKSSKKSVKKDTSKKNETKMLVWAVILVCLLIVLAISLTYAYFTRNLYRSGGDPETVVETGKLDVDFQTSQYITNTNATLINDEDAYLNADKTIFSVARSEYNTVQYVYYTLQLVDIDISDNLKSPYLKWRLYETADITAETEALSNGDFTELSCEEDADGNETCTMDLYSTKIPLAKEAIDDFTLIIWLSNDEEKNQTELLKGTVSAMVQVTAVNN